ncbi:MAG TPA: hypothetical protein VIR34_16865 [Gemmatimonadaceae bacterium]|jgi:hypothetical protein
MKCPKCSDRTEVLQTFPGKDRTTRRRRCLNPSCGKRFTSHELLPGESPRATPGSSDILETLSKRKREPGSGFDPEAIAAAIAVDRRRAQIERERKRLARIVGQSDYENDSGFDPAPVRLDRATLRKELEGY